jgi:cytochrome c553
MENTVRIFLIPLFAAAAAALAPGAAAQTGDANLARNLAATCANCHGTGGVAQGDFESLAGKPKDELVRKMQDFKTGKRPATVMHQLAKGYTDEQIDLVSGWFAAQKPPAK